MEMVANIMQNLILKKCGLLVEKSKDVIALCPHSQMGAVSSCPEMRPFFPSRVSLEEVTGNTGNSYLSISHQRALESLKKSKGLELQRLPA